MKKFILMGALAATISLSLVPSVFAEGDSAVIDQYSQGLGANTVSQVSSVSELTDVDPNQWAFQSLKSLVERYGCIEGYPSKKYLGNRPLSRYEFAAGLNSCLDKIGEQIAAATADKATKDDLAAVQRLQEEFKVELATLRGRVDSLEAKTKELEAHQFSTTTKLDGSVVMAVQGGSAGGNVNRLNPAALPVTLSNAFDNGTVPAAFVPIFQDAVRQALANPAAFPTAFTSASGSAANTLNLRASFTGKDELLVRLRGVTGQEISSTFPGISSNLGTAFYGGNFDGSTAAPATNGNATVSFDKIRYTTNLFGDNFRIFVGPRIDLFEIIDTNSFANNEEVDFSNGFLINNPLITYIFAGPGAGADWKISDQFSLRAAYIAGQGGRSNGFGNGGLTGSDSISSVELEFRPSQSSKIKLQYSGFTTQNGPNPVFTSVGSTANTPNAPQKTDAFGVNAEWAITPSVGVFGRYGTGTQKTFSAFGDQTLSTWQLGFAFPDLFAPGNTLGIAAGQPIKITSGSLSALNSGTELNYELYYNFKLNDRITLTPDIQLISQPNNIAGNPTITVGTLRAVFNF
jgi:Carbohydrate-selective porin, OprB family/S-layer homology domain